MSTTESTVAAEQLLRMPDLGRCELVRGEVITRTPSGGGHGRVTVSITVPLGAHVKRHRLGAVLGAETGFLIARDPDTVRAPDVSFVAKDRLSIIAPRGYVQGPPDLAVEVLSPDDRAGEVLDNVQQWLDAGCRAVWVIDPKTRSVTVYRSDRDIAVLRESETLCGDDVVEGFAIAVRELFEE